MDIENDFERTVSELQKDYMLDKRLRNMLLPGNSPAGHPQTTTTTGAGALPTYDRWREFHEQQQREREAYDLLRRQLEQMMQRPMPPAPAPSREAMLTGILEELQHIRSRMDTITAAVTAEMLTGSEGPSK